MTTGMYPINIEAGKVFNRARKKIVNPVIEENQFRLIEMFRIYVPVWRISQYSKIC